MAYQTGTASSPADLLSQLETFITGLSLGWAVTACTTGKNYNNTTTNIYCGVFYDTTNVYLLGATGVNGALAWSAQPGNAGGTINQSTSNDMPGPYTAYHFFVTADYIHVVTEISAGIYKHFVIGNLAKSGAYTGGTYVQAVRWYPNSTSYTNAPDSSINVFMFDYAAAGTSYYKNWLRADIDAKTDNWMQQNPAINGNNHRGSMRSSGISFGLWYPAASAFSGVTPLLPILFEMDRGGGLISIAGQVQDVRYINMRDIAPGQSITIGSDTWLCFPVIQKTDVWNQNTTVPSSGYYGYAYRIVP